MKLTTTFLTALSCWGLTTTAEEQIVLQDNGSQAPNTRHLNVAIIGMITHYRKTDCNFEY